MSGRRWAAEDSSSDEESVVETKPVEPEPEPIEEHHNAQEEVMDYGDNTIVVLNINYNSHEDDLNDFFVSKGCQIKHLEFFQTDRKFNGRASVTFEDAESVKIALDLNECTFQGKNIRIRLDQKQPQHRPNNNRRPARDYDNNRRDNNFKNSRGDARGDARGEYSREPRGDYPRGGDARERDPFPGRRGEKKDNFRGRPQRDFREREPAPQAPTDSQDAVPPVPPSRPRLTIAPRTKPIDMIGTPASYSSIFGGGKPHDEKTYEEKKKAVEVSTIEETPASKSEEVVPAIEKLSLEESKPTEQATKSEQEPVESTNKDETGDSKKKFQKDRKPRAQRPKPEGDEARPPRKQSDRERKPDHKERPPKKESTGESTNNKESSGPKKEGSRNNNNKKHPKKTQESAPEPAQVSPLTHCYNIILRILG